MTTSSVSFFSVSSAASAAVVSSAALVAAAAVVSVFSVSAALLFALFPHPGDYGCPPIAAAKSRLTCFFFMFSSM